MAYKLLATAQERWRRLNGHELVTDVLDGVKFQDGIKATDNDNHDDDEIQTRGSPPDHSSLPNPQHLTIAPGWHLTSVTLTLRGRCRLKPEALVA